MAVGLMQRNPILCERQRANKIVMEPALVIFLCISFTTALRGYHHAEGERPRHEHLKHKSSDGSPCFGLRGSN